MNSDPNSNIENESQDSLIPQYAPPSLGNREIETADFVEADLIQINPRRLSWSGILAWAFVISTTLTLFSVVAYSQLVTEPEVGGNASSKDLMQVQLQAKTIVGQKRFLESQGQALPENFQTIPTELDSGPYEQRLCYAILVNEVEGPAAAIEYLEELEEKVDSSGLDLTDEQVQMRNTLSGLFDDYEMGILDTDATPVKDRQLIEDRLEWIGKLAFLPAGTPSETDREKLVSETTEILVVGIVAVILGGFLCLIGIGLAITFIALLSCGKLKSRFTQRPYNHNVYIETFAIWMGLFFGSSIVFSFIKIPDPLTGMMLQPFVFFGSLIALGWPVLRGIPFAQVRRDIGWTSESAIKETLSAVPTYLSTLPFLIPGIILLTVMTTVVAGFHTSHEFARPVTPGHPVQDYIMSGGIPMILLVFLTACVAAPIVEETMFRGVLYRHLRDLSAGWKRWASILFSALINGLIFASIHPQGIYGIPVLATLAIGFSLAREWRGSLISSMVMHAIHNTVITCISLVIL